jgi:hypothetical protein
MKKAGRVPHRHGRLEVMGAITGIWRGAAVLLIIGSVPAALGVPKAQAGQYDAQMGRFFEQTIRAWAMDRTILDAVRAQNALTQDYAQDDIDRLDKTWRAEVGQTETRLIQSVTSLPVSDHVRQLLMAMGGAVTEIIVMDALGLNVATSGVPSDYWQGDEAKHQQTYGVGPDAVHFGDIEYDESSQKYQAQISFTLSDPDTNAPIGAMTVAVDAEEFF